MTHPLRRLAPVVRLAHAKLNLTLAVVGRRPDGFHALHSIMVPLALADRLSFAPSGGSEDTLHVVGFDLGAPGDNLVLRALAVARGTVAREDVGHSPGLRFGAAIPAAVPLSVRLEKRIPVSAGLGGGSADAAATIDGALEAWDIHIDPHMRLSIGARLGSDVPFCLEGGPALVEGRGEHVSRVRGVVGPPPGVLLVSPGIAISTADVYEAWAAGARGPGGAARSSSEHLAGEFQRGIRAAELMTRAAVLASANDLLPATLALAPALVGFRRALTRLLGRPVGQSGSGPTCWVLYPSPEEAEAAAHEVRAALADGRLASPGERSAIVEATSFAIDEHGGTNE